jgi:6-phosphofructokinase 1
MNTADAIKQRHVDLNLVAFHESLGVCFGRAPQKIQPNFKKIDGGVERHL